MSSNAPATNTALNNLIHQGRQILAVLDDVERQIQRGLRTGQAQMQLVDLMHRRLTFARLLRTCSEEISHSIDRIGQEAADAAREAHTINQTNGA